MQHRDIGRYHAIHANALGFRLHSGRNVDRLTSSLLMTSKVTTWVTLFFEKLLLD